LKAKKSFGQHFLNREDIARRIANSLECTDQYQRVVEVGPGRGMLTQYLLEKDFELIVVEADKDMVLYLNKYYPQLKEHIIAGDFLKVRFEEFLGDDPFGLIGNFPYNISSQIIFKMLDYRHQVPEMVGMFQKEMAERVVAQPGTKTYGAISVLTQAYYEGTYLFTVDKSCFSPPPKVQSAVIRLARKKEQTLSCDPVLFKQVVKISFGQRRKMLRNTMKSLVADKSVLDGALFKRRPETLSVAEFVELTDFIEQHRK
jgi:16S rRNA (adenine1518-N6/adenine1519-N6)-dimethyltransferase